MAVRLEFIDLIVPVRVIEDKYPGGLAQCLRDYAPLLGRRVWHDGYLLRDGAFDPVGARERAEGWQALGLEPLQWVRGALRWQDICVIDTAVGGPTVPCDWILYDPVHRTASLKGAPPVEVAGRGPADSFGRSADRARVRLNALQAA
jgi:hypothetical protein